MGKTGQNLQLDRPRLLLPEGGRLRKWIFYWTVLLIGGLGCWGNFITAFQLRVQPAFLVGLGIFCAAFSVWRAVDGKRKGSWKLTALVWGVWLLCVWFSFETIFHGAVRSLNAMLAAYGGRLNYDLPVFYVPYQRPQPADPEAWECTALIASLLLPFFWTLSQTWIRGNPLGPFAVTGLMLCLNLGFSILPEEWAMGALLLFWCLLLLTSSSLSGSGGIIKEKARYRASGAASANPILLALVPAMAVAMVLIHSIFPKEGYKRPEFVEKLRIGAESGFGLTYAQGGQGNGNSWVQLTKLGGRDYTGETMLRVRFTWEEPAVLLDSSGNYSVRDEMASRDQNKSKEYLKSFVGTVYTGQSWQRLPAEARSQAQNLAIKSQNMPAGYKENLDTYQMDSTSSYTLLVENLGANPRCIYVPSSMASTEEDLAPYQLEFVEDGFVKSKNIFTGTRAYRLQGLGLSQAYSYFARAYDHNYSEFKRASHISITKGGASKTGNLLQNPYIVTGDISSSDALRTAIYGGVWTASNSKYIPFWSEGRYYEDEYMVEMQREDGTELYISPKAVAESQQKLMESLEEQSQEMGSPFFEEELWTLPDWGEPLFTQEELEWLRSVEEYTEFVYDHYLQVPQELADYLNRFREAFGLESSQAPVQQNYFSIIADSFNPQSAGGEASSGQEGLAFRDGAQFFANKLGELFRTYYSYSLSPPQPEEGRDFVEYFLEESQEGYCVHFATAAVLLLRSAGYPARYAEGYVVPCDQQDWVDVPDYNAHAWAEVYVAGLGWVPVEVTPPSEDAPAVFENARLPEDLDSALGGITAPADPMPTVRPRENEPQTSREPLGPSYSPSVSSSPQPSGAGARVYRDESFWPVMFFTAGGLILVLAGLLIHPRLRQRLREKSFAQQDRNQAALKAYVYLQRLSQWEKLCGVQEPPPKRWKELAEKARFGRGMLSEEELRELTAAAEQLRQKLWAQLPWLTRLRCKYIFGLI